MHRGIALSALMMILLTACNSDSESGNGNASAEAAPAATTETAPPVQEPAAEVDPQMSRAAEVRQSVLKLVRHNFVPIVGMARGQRPFDGDVAATNGARIQQLSQMLADAFVVDTRGSGVTTEALDRIWEEPELFAEKAAAFVAASEAFAQAAQSGDQDTTLGAFGDLGQSCGGCHDEFREDN